MTTQFRRGAIAVLTPVLVAALLALARVTATSFGVLSNTGFMPHRMCLYGAAPLILVDAIADEIVTICYLLIPLMLMRVFTHGIVIQPNDHHKIGHAAILLPWFSAFILSCGLSHQMDVITLWFPFYYADCAIRLMTAVASVGTCIVLRMKIPILMGIVTTADLMVQVQLLVSQVRKLEQAASGIGEVKQ